MKLFKQIVLILIILAVGIFLRFYKLDKIPNGLYVDEAAIGYNAYSFFLTGKDEYGKAFPIFLRSYGAFSSPLYTYLTEIPVKVWGLNIFSVRFLSALTGALSIIVFYLLLLRLNLFKNKYAFLIGAFLFAISPWSVFFSRGAFEANFALLLLLSGVYFLLAKKKIFLNLILAAIFLSVSTYAYQAERLIAHLVFFGYIFLFIAKSNFRRLIKKEIIVAAVLFILIQLPQLSLSFSPAFRNRATGLFYTDVVKTLWAFLLPGNLVPNIFPIFLRETFSLKGIPICREVFPCCPFFIPGW
jgi:predicted membrane-bound mannosyltransferase